jgi:hypothetical protein
MEWNWGRRTVGAARGGSRTRGALIALGALALAGCNPDDQTVSIAQPRGASVAFDSLDGLPPGQFQKLVQDLNDEAQVRRLAVISREQPSAYRVRGYLAVKVSKRQTTVAWVWDVFDREEQRALRISGEETLKIRHRDAWTVADDSMLKRIASSSMEQLASFLTSPDVAPGIGPPAEAQVAMGPQEATPEAAGIFRITRAQADPINTAQGLAPDDSEPIPLPSRRPSAPASFSERETQALTTASR